MRRRTERPDKAARLTPEPVPPLFDDFRHALARRNSPQNRLAPISRDHPGILRAQQPFHEQGLAGIPDGVTHKTNPSDGCTTPIGLPFAERLIRGLLRASFSKNSQPCRMPREGASFSGTCSPRPRGMPARASSKGGWEITAGRQPSQPAARP